MCTFVLQLDHKLQDFFRELEGILCEPDGFFQNSRRLLKIRKALFAQMYFVQGIAVALAATSE